MNQSRRSGEIGFATRKWPRPICNCCTKRPKYFCLTTRECTTCTRKFSDFEKVDPIKQVKVTQFFARPSQRFHPYWKPFETERTCNRQSKLLSIKIWGDIWGQNAVLETDFTIICHQLDFVKYIVVIEYFLEEKKLWKHHSTSHVIK